MDGIMSDGKKIPWEDLLALCNRKEAANKELRSKIEILEATLHAIDAQIR